MLEGHAKKGKRKGSFIYKNKDNKKLWVVDLRVDMVDKVTCLVS